jgi:hypothetical protein
MEQYISQPSATAVFISYLQLPPAAIIKKQDIVTSFSYLQPPGTVALIYGGL